MVYTSSIRVEWEKAVASGDERTMEALIQPYYETTGRDPRLIYVESLFWVTELNGIAKTDPDLLERLIEKFPNLIRDYAKARGCDSSIYNIAVTLAYQNRPSAIEKIYHIIDRPDWRKTFLEGLSTRISPAIAASQLHKKTDGLRLLINFISKTLGSQNVEPSAEFLLAHLIMNGEGATKVWLDSCSLSKSIRQSLVNKAFQHLGIYILPHYDTENHLYRTGDALLSMGADVASEETYSLILNNAIHLDSLATLNYLLAAGINPNTEGTVRYDKKFGRPETHLAALNLVNKLAKGKEYIQLLLKYGADPLLIDRKGDPVIFDFIGVPNSTGAILKRYASFGIDLLSLEDGKGKNLFLRCIKEIDQSGVKMLIKLDWKPMQLNYSDWNSIRVYLSNITQGRRTEDLSTAKRKQSEDIYNFLLKTVANDEAAASHLTQLTLFSPTGMSHFHQAFLQRIRNVNDLQVEDMPIAKWVSQHAEAGSVSFDCLKRLVDSGLHLSHQQMTLFVNHAASEKLANMYNELFSEMKSRDLSSKVLAKSASHNDPTFNYIQNDGPGL